MIEASYEDHVQALRPGDIDTIFGALRMPPAHDGLIEEQLFGDPCVLVRRNAHPLARAGAVTPHQLADYDFSCWRNGITGRSNPQPTSATQSSESDQIAELP